MPTVSRDTGWSLPYPFDEDTQHFRIGPRVDVVAWRRCLMRGAARARAACRSVAFRVLAPPVAACVALAAVGVRHVYCVRDDVPDLERFVRFEAPTVGAIEDANGELLIELAREYRHVLRYDDLPPVVRDAIVCAV